MDGLIVKGIGGFYYVKTSDGKEYECKARGVFRKKHITPMIGDRVSIEKTESGKGSINEIYPRTSSLIRPPVANIDTMIIVAAATSPDPNLFLLDKMLVNAEIGGIEPIICINKTDLALRADIEKIYKTAGYRVIVSSAENGDGLDELKRIIKDKVTAFSGLSGVGKSTLLGMILNENLETGMISEKINRGKHTTRHVGLFELPEGGFVLDTPGFSSLEIEGIKADELQKYFPEMSGCEDLCKFRGCSHINETDCAVREQLGSDLSESRSKSYIALYNKLKQLNQWPT